MQKLILFLFILNTILLPIECFSQFNKMCLYGGGAYQIPFGDFADEDVYAGKGNANKGAGVHAGGKLRFYGNYFIGIEGVYNKFGPRDKTANYDIFISTLSVTASVDRYFGLDNFRPYVTMGAGLSRVSFDLQTDFFEETSSGWCASFNLAGGCEMMITDHAALFGFIKWIDIFTRNKEFVYNKFQTITPQFNINILGFGAGYKYWLH